VIPNSVQEEHASPDVTGTSCCSAERVAKHRSRKGPGESALVPRPRNPWEAHCSPACRVLRQGPGCGDSAGAHSHRDLRRRRLGDRDERTAAGPARRRSGGPRRSGVGRRRIREHVRAPDRRCHGGAVPTIVMHACSRAIHGALAGARAATALAILQRRILRRSIAARLSDRELRLVCDEDSDYASETLLPRGRAQGGERGPLGALRHFAHPANAVYF